jgi:hypothetical protein
LPVTFGADPPHWDDPVPLNVVGPLAVLFGRIVDIRSKSSSVR